MLKNYQNTASANVAAASANVSLYVWGDNSGGQLGIGSTINKSLPTAVSNFLNGRSFAQLVAGTSHSVAIDTLGSLWTWGKNNLGQLGDGTTIDKLSPVKIGSNSWSGVGTAGNTSIAVSTTGTLFAWGDNSGYQVGDGTTINRSSPVQISAGYYNAPTYNSWTAIAAKDAVSNSMAIRADGSLWTWGSNTVGQRGDGTTVNRSSPIQIGVGSWSTISVSESTCAAIDTLGRLYVWGSNSIGQIGDGTTVNRSSPVQIGTSSWSKVSTGTNHTLAISSNGTLWAWGFNLLNTLGDGTTIARSSPVQIGSSSWSVVSAGQNGSNFSTGIDINGRLYAWGNNSVGQLGTNLPFNANAPTQIANGTSFITVSAGTTYAAAISTTGALYTWGFNGIGNLGDGTTINRSSPVQIGTSSWTKVSAGDAATFAIDTNNTLYAWGLQSTSNPYLADPSVLSRSSPAAVTTIPGVTVNSWKAVASTISHTVAIRATDNTLWTWGLNTNGILGDGTTLAYYMPKQIGSRAWNKLGKIQGATHVVAIDSTGGLWSWGINNFGQLGDGTTIDKSSPVQIGTSSWTMAAASGNYTVAIDITGALYTWGRGVNGSIGNGTTISKSSPVQVGTSSWTMASVNEYGTVGAIDTVGRLFFWGSTASGNGDGTTINKSSPVQIGSSSWSFVGFGGFNSVAIDVNGRLFNWGNTGTGVMGYYAPSAATQSSPVQVAVGTSFVSVSMGRTHAVALDTTQNLWAWGNNTSPALVGLGGISIALVPARVGTSSWTTAFAGCDTTFAIDITGKLWAWGKNDNGLLGTNSAGALTVKPLMSQVVTTTASVTPSIISRAAVIDNLGALYTWGVNSGDGTSETKFIPVKVLSGSLAIADTSFSNVLSSGFGTYTLAVSGNTSIANIYAWGTNTNNAGGIGNFAQPYFTVPTQVDYNQLDIAENPATRTTVFIANESWNKISVAQSSAMAIRGDGSLWGWGQSGLGQLGYGGLTFITHPVQIGSSSWSAVASGLSTVAAIDVNGRLYNWGNSTGGAWNDSDVRLYPFQIGSSSWTAVYAVSQTHYAIDINRRLFAWGNNAQGQMGDGTTVLKSSPVQIGTSSWTALGGLSGGALGSHQVAIDAAGRLFTWGVNVGGQLGDGTTINRSSPVQIGTSSWSAVAAGASFSLAVDINGRLFSWGNYNFALGDGSTIGRSSPVQIGIGLSWTGVWAGFVESFARTTDGTMYAWGFNTTYNLGLGTNVTQTLPVAVSAPTGAQYTQVAAGYTSTVAIASDGTAYIFGNSSSVTNFDGTGNKLVPTQFGTLSANPGKNIKKITTTGTNATLIQDQANVLWSAGNNTTGELGTLTTVGRVTPGRVPNVYNTVKLASGPTTNFAIAQKSSTSANYQQLYYLHAWGASTNGQLGNGDYVNRSSPVTISLISGTTNRSWNMIATAPFSTHTVAIASDGTLWAWGSNDAGQLGTNNLTFYSSPVQVSTSSWTAVFVNQKTSMAIDINGVLWAWGDNTFGQLGMPLGAPSVYATFGLSSPTQVPASATVAPNNSWKALSVTSSGVMAIASDGGLWGWGYNSIGCLGVGDVASRPVPSKVGNSSWTMVSTGGPNYTMGAGITIDGGLWTWGNNSNGSIGDGTTVAKSSPVKIGTSSWSLVSVGDGFVTAIDIVGRLFTWGYNSVGQLGSGTTVNRSSPVQIGTSSWSAVGVGNSTAGAVNSTGLLYFWGYNGQGQLGDGTTINRSSPVQIGTSSWTKVVAGRFNSATSAAIRIDGALFLWGINGSGSIGDGTVIAKSSPVQIGTSSWIVVDCCGAFGNTYAIDINRRFFAWGNGTGGLPDGVGNARSSPIQIGTSSWSAASAGYFCGMGIKADGTLWGWGTQGVSVIYANNFFSPVQVSSSYTLTYGQSWTAVSIGSSHVNAIDSTGALYAWGKNENYTFGDSTMTAAMTANQQLVPYKITGSIGNSSWIAVAAGQSMATAVSINSARYAWGSNAQNQFGQIGPGTGVFSTPQGGTDQSLSFKQLGAGVSHMWGLSTNGTLYTWGTNNFGQLGDGTTIIKSSPTQIGTSSYTYVAAGGNHTAAVTISGALYTWGINNGHLGDGTTINKSSPVQIGYTNYGQFGLSASWQAVAALANDTLVINQSNRKIYGTGVNSQGTLGVGDVITRYGITEILTTSTPVSPVHIATGSSHVVAVFNDGTTNLLYAWGYNNTGQLGDGTTLNNIIPAKITDYKYLKNLIAGSNFTYKQ
jgi:alpha-tubulin suppressor-like RCC1 family protein